jgi:mRNA interferase MazF
MKRGEIYIADLDPTVGKEIRKRRPVLIVSSNASNQVRHLLTVVPLTSNVSKVHAFEVRLPGNETGLPKESKAMPHQIRTISVERLRGKRLGAVSASLMMRIDAAIKLHLALA